MFSKNESWYTHKCVGVPGTVRGMELAHKRFGKLPWKDLVMPAVKLANGGFALDAATVKSLNNALKRNGGSDEFHRVFSKDGKPDWQVGDRLVQTDLAKTLRQIAEEGPDAFYSGELAYK